MARLGLCIAREPARVIRLMNTTSEIAVFSLEPLWREGICRILAQEKSYRPVAAPVERAAILAWLRRRNTDLLLYEMTVPSPGHMELLHELTTRSSGLKIVVLVGDASEDNLAQAIGFGVQGYITRNSTPNQLIRTIQAVIEGEICVSPKLLNKIVGNRRQAAAPRAVAWSASSKLTPRESEIAELVSIGLSNREVADRLAVTQATVKSHLNDVFKKLNVRRRLQLALYVRNSRMAS